ncbi:MAG: potassium-transporting ATPase subunit KdpA, partial [Anaerovoracaceae bacterium]
AVFLLMEIPGLALSGAGESATIPLLLKVFRVSMENFILVAAGLAVFFALVRRLVHRKKQGFGNFWVDMTRIILYVLIPLNLVLAVGVSGAGIIVAKEQQHQVQTVEEETAGSRTDIFMVQ